jgi:hypothetical protein
VFVEGHGLVNVAPTQIATIKIHAQLVHTKQMQLIVSHTISQHLRIIDVCTIDANGDGKRHCVNAAGNSGAICRESADACDEAEKCDGIVRSKRENTFVMLLLNLVLWHCRVLLVRKML